MVSIEIAFASKGEDIQILGLPREKMGGWPNALSEEMQGI